MPEPRRTSSLSSAPLNVGRWLSEAVWQGLPSLGKQGWDHLGARSGASAGLGSAPLESPKPAIKTR